MSSGLRLDLHVHSRHSPDSTLSVEEIVDGLGPAGLQGFALTDHNTLAGHAELAQLSERYPRLRLVPGIEISTVEGHLLGLGLTELPPIHRPFEETCRWVTEHGGVPVPSHPMRWSHGIGRRLAERAPVPALETVNGHNSESANARAELVAARRGLGGTGGSDVHEMRDLGRAYTEFPPGVDSVEEILEALRARRTQGGGRSFAIPDRLRLAFRTTLLRISRGMRPV